MTQPTNKRLLTEARVGVSGGVARADSAPVSVKQYGAKGDGVTDDAAAIKAAISAAGVGGTIFLPPGTYGVGSTIAIKQQRLLGGNANGGSVLKALTAGMTVVQYESSSVLMDFQVDGNHLAKWGLKNVSQSNKAHMQRVRVQYCTDAGFVFEALQNSVLIDLMSQYNKYGYALYNGVASCKFINCNANNTNNTDPDARGVLIANNTTDPGLDGVVHFNGNRSNTFFGGVYERILPGTYQVEILDAGGYTTFMDAEIDGAASAALHIGANVGSYEVHLERASFPLVGGTTPDTAVIAEGGKIRNNHSNFSGLTGKSPLAAFTLSGTATLQRSVDSSTTPPNILDMASSFFQSGVGGWGASGAGTVAWQSSNWRMVVTSTGTNNGAKILWVGAYGPYIAAGRYARVSFLIRNPTGGALTAVNWLTSGTTRNIGNFPEGEHSVLVELVGDEIGLSITSAAGAMSVEVCYITAAIF